MEALEGLRLFDCLCEILSFYFRKLKQSSKLSLRLQYFRNTRNAFVEKSYGRDKVTVRVIRGGHVIGGTRIQSFLIFKKVMSVRTGA